jgi:hypothetical protein
MKCALCDKEAVMHVAEKRYEGATETVIERHLCAEHAAKFIRDNRPADPRDKSESQIGDACVR